MLLLGGSPSLTTLTSVTLLASLSPAVLTCGELSRAPNTYAQIPSFQEND